MNIKPIRPEDILANGIDTAQFSGRVVRKGTIGAFLANAEILEHSVLNETQRQEIIAMMKTLAPDVIAIGLHKHVVFKNPVVEKILVDAKI